MRIGRRAVLKGGLGLGLGRCLAPAVVAGQVDPASVRPREGDLLVKVGDALATPLTPADIPFDAIQMMAWAMDPSDKTVRSGTRLNQILLVRFEADLLSAETKPRAAAGVVAYTAICTHTGCDVVDWLPDEHVLYCPCHFTKFDPRDGAKVVDGPAPRTLPALPLKVVDGKLVVAQPFTAPVGFERG